MRVKRKEEPEERSSLQPNTAGTPQLRSQGSPAITQAVYTEKKKAKKKSAKSAWERRSFPFVLGIQGRGRISMQPGQPEIDISGLGSSLRLVKKEERERTVSRSPRHQWAVWRVDGARCAGPAQFQALAQIYFSRVRRVHNLQHINR